MLKSFSDMQPISRRRCSLLSKRDRNRFTFHQKNAFKFFYSFGLEFVIHSVCRTAPAFNPDKQLLKFIFPGAFYCYVRSNVKRVSIVRILSFYMYIYSNLLPLWSRTCFRDNKHRFGKRYGGITLLNQKLWLPQLIWHRMCEKRPDIKRNRKYVAEGAILEGTL